MFSLAPSQLIGSGLSDVECSRYALVVSGSPVRGGGARIAQLAKTASAVVAVDSGAEALRAVGITPNLLLGDFDSIRWETLEAFRATGVELSAHDAYKDATDLELALNELCRRGYTDVVATNALGGRIDHELATLGNLAAAAEQGMAVSLIEEGESCVFLSAAGGRHTLRLSDVSGRGVTGSGSLMPVSFISLIPWGGEATVSVRGVEWELNHAVLVPASSLGVSNVPRASHVDVEVHAGTTIVVLEL
jgi:thiamine pyrophosphokinase